METRILRALEGSITKWDLICQGLGLDRGSDNCPLCRLFYASDCEGCPVMEASGTSFCENTPYKDVNLSLMFHLLTKSDHLLFYIYHPGSVEFLADCFYQAVEAAEAELIFLLTLLPKDHKWRNQL